MTSKIPLNYSYYGIAASELGDKYVQARLAGRADIVAEIDVLVFESGQFDEDDLDEFLAAADEADDLPFGFEEDEIEFNDVALMRAMIANGINPY